MRIINSKGMRILLAALLLLTLCGCGAKSAADKTVVILEASPTPTAAADAVEDSGTALAADWYGWWKMDHCSGDWSHMYGYYWDCCAELMEAEDGKLGLLLWDEDMPRDNCLAQAELEEQNGALRVLAGGFLDRELGASDWKLTKSEDACGSLLRIEGEYKAIGKGGFHYVIYLRPWGSRWPGSADERPFYYESWYLPLIEAGEPMPDKIG